MSEDTPEYRTALPSSEDALAESRELYNAICKQKPIDPKGDAGALKTPLHLIPPCAEIAMAEVLKLGAAKYGQYNWRQTTVKESTYMSAIMRHLNSFRSGETIDPESGQSHIAHIMANCAILLDADKHGSLHHDLAESEVKRSGGYIPPCVTNATLEAEITTGAKR